MAATRRSTCPAASESASLQRSDALSGAHSLGGGGSQRSSKCSQSSATAPLRRRRAIPPGALSSYMQAQRTCSSLGILLSPTSRTLRPGPRPAGSATSASTTVPAEMPRPAMTCEPHAVRRTIAELFNQRKRQLTLRHAACQRRGRKQCRHHQGPASLLSLPEDIMLKIVCNLRHSEIRPLFGVCRELRQTMTTAVQMHFSFLTPHRTAEELAALHATRPMKRLGGQIAPLMPATAVEPSHNTPPRDMATGLYAAPRALVFQDAEPEAEGSSSA